MHDLIRKKTILPRIFLCALYVLFFAVQLNLRYNSIEVNPSASYSYAAGKQEAGSHKISVGEQKDDRSTVTTRLNKRYYPGYCNLVQAPPAPANQFQFISESTAVYETSFFPQQHHPFSLRRGPPAGC